MKLVALLLITGIIAGTNNNAFNTIDHSLSKDLQVLDSLVKGSIKVLT
jgi:hypothetical protein